MSVISQRIQKMEESVTIKMARLAGELKASGKDVISLSLGEPDFATPDFIKEAAKQAIDENYTHYTPVPGYPELRKAICEKFKRDNNLDYTPEQIVASTGAKHSLMNVVLSIVDPGEEVILPAPYWVSYIEMVRFAEGVPIVIDTTIETDFKITPAQLEKSITKKTKAFLFSNPCNPSGTVYTHEELAALAEVFAKHPQVYIISDEIYEYINFQGDNTSLGSFDSIKERVITVNGLAKGYAMTGWRLGYIGAPLEIAKACGKLQGQFTSGTCSITQRAAIVALKADPEKMAYMKEEFAQRRELMMDLLKDVPGIAINNPMGAFYVFPEVSSYFGKRDGDRVITDVDDLCMYLLETCQVAMTGGEAFGCPNNLRISYANSQEQLREAIRRVKAQLAKLS